MALSMLKDLGRRGNLYRLQQAFEDQLRRLVRRLLGNYAGQLIHDVSRRLLGDLARRLGVQPMSIVVFM